MILASPTSSADMAVDTPPETSSQSEDETGPNWWGTLWEKIEEAKDWATDVFDTVKDNFVTGSS